MTNPKQSVDEIIERIFSQWIGLAQWEDEPNYKRFKEDLREGILELILSTRPEEAVVTAKLGKDYAGWSRGYNRGIEDWEKAIKDCFK